MFLEATLDNVGVHTNQLIYSTDFDKGDDYYNGMTAVVVEGTDFGASYVYDFDAATDKITLNTPLPFTPADGAICYILPPGDPAVGKFGDTAGTSTVLGRMGVGNDTRAEPGSASSCRMFANLHYLGDGLKGEIDDYNRVMGKRQVLEVSVTSAANAADTTLATVEDQPCVIEQVVVSADAAPHADFTNCSVKGGVNKVVTFIAKADCTDADLTVADEQVTWDNQGAVARLAATKTIVMEHTGDGAGPLDLTVTIVYYAAVSGGYLA